MHHRLPDCDDANTNAGQVTHGLRVSLDIRGISNRVIIVASVSANPLETVLGNGVGHRVNVQPNDVGVGEKFARAQQ